MLVIPLNCREDGFPLVPLRACFSDPVLSAHTHTHTLHITGKPCLQGVFPGFSGSRRLEGGPFPLLLRRRHLQYQFRVSRGSDSRRAGLLHSQHLLVDSGPWVPVILPFPLLPACATNLRFFNQSHKKKAFRRTTGLSS